MSTVSISPINAARSTLAAQSHRAHAWALALRNEGRETLRNAALEAIGNGQPPRDALARVLLDHATTADGAAPFAVCGSLHRWCAGNWNSVPFRELSMGALAAFDGLAGCKGLGDAIGVADRVLVIAAQRVADLGDVAFEPEVA